MVVKVAFGPDAAHTFKAPQWVPASTSDSRASIHAPRCVVIDQTHDLLYRRKFRLGSAAAREERCFDICEMVDTALRRFPNAAEV